MATSPKVPMSSHGPFPAAAKAGSLNPNDNNRGKAKMSRKLKKKGMYNPSAMSALMKKGK